MSSYFITQNIYMKLFVYFVLTVGHFLNTKHEPLLFTRVNDEASVANDLCIKGGHGCK